MGWRSSLNRKGHEEREGPDREVDATLTQRRRTCRKDARGRGPLNRKGREGREEGIETKRGSSPLRPSRRLR